MPAVSTCSCPATTRTKNASSRSTERSRSSRRERGAAPVERGCRCAGERRARRGGTTAAGERATARDRAPRRPAPGRRRQGHVVARLRSTSAAGPCVVVLGLAVILESVSLFGFPVLAPDIQDSLGVERRGDRRDRRRLRRAVPARLDPAQHARRPPPPQAGRRDRDRRCGRWSCSSPGSCRTRSSCSSPGSGSGLGQSYQLPVNGPLLMDTYPIEARGRVFALTAASQMVGHAARAAVRRRRSRRVAGGDRGLAVGVHRSSRSPAIPIASPRPGSREPRRGRNEMRAVLGEELAERRRTSCRSRCAWRSSGSARSRRFYFFLVGMAALGFALFSVAAVPQPVLRGRASASTRSSAGSSASARSCPDSSPSRSSGRRSRRAVPAEPAAAMVFIGLLVAAFGVFIVVGVFMPSIGAGRRPRTRSATRMRAGRVRDPARADRRRSSRTACARAASR